MKPLKPFLLVLYGFILTHDIGRGSDSIYIGNELLSFSFSTADTAPMRMYHHLIAHLKHREERSAHVTLALLPSISFEYDGKPAVSFSSSV